MDEHDCASQLSIPSAPGPSRVVTAEVPLGSVLFLSNLIPHRSLENFSERIRWSLDLRWQRAGESNGFWGIKDSLPLFARDDSGQLMPGFKADFETWGKVDRNALQAAAVSDAEKAKEKDPFDTTITGPWMGQWSVMRSFSRKNQLRRVN
jgi:hypothetical protein